MESKSHETPSPSASSGFLPLGRRGSRASMATTQTERENITAALDQIHTAAYQSDSLTLFNDFTTPPGPTLATDEKGLSEELQGGLSGLYSRFRTSVGGMRDIVSGGTRSTDRNAAETPAVKSPISERSMTKSVSDLAASSGDYQQSHPNSSQGSRLHSPVATHFQISQEAVPQLNAGKGSKISSKSPSISSKTSISPSPGIKATIGPLTKSTGNSIAADPAVAQLYVNTAGQNLRSRSSSVNLSQQGVKTTESASTGSGDGPIEPPLSQTSSVLNQSLSHSPVLSIKTHGSFQEEPSTLENNGPLTLTTNVLDVPPRKLVPADQQRTAEGTSQVIATRNSKHAEPGQEAVPPVQDNRSNSRMSFGFDDSSLSEVSNFISKAAPSGSAAALDGIIAMPQESTKGNELPKAPTASKPGEKPKPPPSNNRLPGYGISRTSTAETITTVSSLPPLNTNIGRFTGQAPRERRDERPRNGALSQIGSKLMSRDFWMRDENAKDCFHCGEPFTTFRRKHHCRTCGQIFDSRCTLLIPGTRFGQPGSIRVCKPCEAMINAHDDDSSEFSDSEQSPIMVNPRLSELSWGGNSARPSVDDDDSSSVISQSIDHVLRTPTMAIPATRRAGEGRSAVLEINPDRPLARPTSSRSLRSSLGGRAHSMGHKRHHSRQQYIRSFKPLHDDRAPFQRRHADDFSTESRLPAFHKDNIIDPELADYLSDDASSGEEQPSLLAAVSESQLSKSGVDGERVPFGGLLAAMKKGRSAFGDRAIPTINQPGRDADEVSLSSSRAVNLPRSSRRRNLSVASSVHRQSPGTKDLFLHDLPVGGTPFPVASNQTGFKQTRSSSMRGVEAPPVELNKASLEHVRRLLQQLLSMSSVPNVDSWENALMPILLKTADEVDPDVQRGDDMDIRHYVKLKKIPGGRPGDTSYVSGLVFTKNLALKSMPRSILRPNILIITFPLEYARQQHHFMSLEPVIRQEREFLENLVSRIAALRPNLLLVENNVSGLALGLLEQAGIAVAYNVKASVLEAVSRCTQTRIVTSMDKLLTTALHSDCISFDVKTYVNSKRKKTYMYISGCPKELGCTIVLRGGDEEVLGKVKEITEFMVYVVYNLRLETCVMRDEFAKLPTSSINDVIQATHEKAGQINGHAVASEGNLSLTESGLPPTTALERSTEDLESKAASTTDAIIDVPDDVPMPIYFDDVVQDHKTKILSASPFVKFEPPYLLMRIREMERRLAYLKRLRDQDGQTQESVEENAAKPQKFILITPEMVHESPRDAPPQVKEVLRAAHDAEYDRVLYHYQTQKRQWEAYVAGCSSMFDPYAHQNIVVLYSLVCTTTSIPCSGPDTFALEFYNEHGDEAIFEPDCTIGQYVEELCHTANSVCAANGCEKRMFEHHRQYVHGDAQISVLVQPYPSKLRGMQETVLMWSCCKICGHETQVTPMSENTWKYSFGKYLEVSFWGRNLHARAGVCPHDLQRDHLRYFGFKDLALRIQYDTIHLLEVVVPRPRVTWKVDNDLKLRNQVYLRTERRVSRFMLSVHARLKSINVQSVVPELLDECKKEIDRLVKKANEHQAALVRLLQEKYSGSRYWEIIPLNDVLRSVQEKVVEWDTTFAEFEQSFFPSEKDIKRLATLQLKKIFLDKDATSVAPDDPLHTPTDPGDENIQENEKPRMLRRMTLSPEKAQNVLVSVVEEHAGKKHREEAIQDIELPPLPAAPADEATLLSADAASCSKSSPQNDALIKEEVRHLDLAAPSSQSGIPPLDQKAPLARSLSSPNAMEVLAAPAVEGPLDADSPPLSPKSTLPSHETSKLKDGGLPRSPSTPPNRPSAIPRLAEVNFRRSGNARSPPLIRTQSQPAHLLRENSIASSSSVDFKTHSNRSFDIRSDSTKTGEKKFAERLGFTALKNGGFAAGHSFIPRSVPKGRHNNHVLDLARRFNQLSQLSQSNSVSVMHKVRQDFEQARLEQRAAQTPHSRAYPLASSKPIVEVYRNVREAVEEREPPVDEEESTLSVPQLPMEETSRMSEGFAEQINLEEPSPQADSQETPPDSFDSGGLFRADSHLMSETELEESPSDEEQATAEDLYPTDSHEDPKPHPEDDSMDLKDFAKHERTTLLKMLTNFWSERSASGWSALDYPLSVVDHVFADCDIIVREDEPSSLVAFALDSSDYKEKLASIQKRYEIEEHVSDSDEDPEIASEARVEHALLRPTGTHLKYQFQEGPAKMLCKVFYAEQFDALRKKCGVADRIVESLSRCAKWDSKGGKTKSLFLKTLDDRFILKSLSPVETQAFLKFAPAYFQIMSEALFHELPSAIAKMFGFYQVIIKNPVTGIEFNWFLLLMENLFYDRKPNRIFDLKGSMRNRKVESTGERDEVLLDENMVDFIYETPLFSREHSKKLLAQSVWNDTLFLGRQDVMDYSLMVAIDDKRSELVVGIIDCIRTYTWDKKLESWIKDRGFAGGGRNRPTVTSPREYKSRFREAMARYVLQAPSCWHQFQPSAPYRYPQGEVSNVTQLDMDENAESSI